MLQSLKNPFCVLVSVLHPLFQPEATKYTPFAQGFLKSFPAIAVIPFLEASRSRRPLLLGFPVITGDIYQLLTAAVTFPVYWALFLTTMRDDAAGSESIQADAEAVLFGMIAIFPPQFRHGGLCCGNSAQG